MTLRRRLALCFAIALAPLAATPSLARASEAGRMDPVFGSGGVVSLDLPGDDSPTSMVKTATGRLGVTILSGNRLWVAVLTADGQLDRSFAGNGVRELTLARDTYSATLQPAPDGGLLVGAWLSDPVVAGLGDSRFAVAKLQPDGQLDRSYGVDGVASTLGGELTLVGCGSAAFKAAPDGSVVVLGVTGAGGYYGAAGVAALLRFTPQGHRDSSFGVRGVAPVAAAAPYPSFSAIDIDARDRIVVGETNNVASPFREEALVRRFLRNGTPDLSFGAAGIAHLAIPGDWKVITQVAVDDAGRIIASGFAAAGAAGIVMARLDPAGPIDPNAGFSPFVARLRENGQPDTSFGRDGVAMVHNDGHDESLSWSGGVALEGAGLFLTAYGERGTNLTTHLLHVDTTGSVDRAFGGGQSLLLPMENTFAVVVLGDRVVVAGEVSWSTGGTTVAGYRR